MHALARLSRAASGYSHVNWPNRHAHWGSVVELTAQREVLHSMGESTIYKPVGIGKGALSEQIAHQILDLVAHRQLEVGSRLPPLDELCTHLRVSRTVVREAIKLLDAWGVLTVKHGVGTFVAGLTESILRIPLKVSVERSEEAILNLHQLREALEPDIAAIAADNAKPEHIEEMEEALRRMDDALANPYEYAQADLDFHSALAQATGNDLFLIVIYSVIDLLQDARCLALQSPGAGERAQAYHQLILEHVKARRADGAREAMNAHLGQAWGEIQSRL